MGKKRAVAAMTKMTPVFPFTAATDHMEPPHLTQLPPAPESPPITSTQSCNESNIIVRRMFDLL
jgi:hypothetical protein